MSVDRNSDPPDFEIRKYELDRAHELELNKFAHGLEIERLKILQLVNGGAFTVLVAFAPGLLRVGGSAGTLALAAALCWVAGLGGAALATHIQLGSQANFNRSVRYRRNALEWRRLDKGDGRVARMVGPPPKSKHPSSDRCYDDYADAAHADGASWNKWVAHSALVSVLLFVAGAMLLTLSIARGGPAAQSPAEQASK